MALNCHLTVTPIVPILNRMVNYLDPSLDRTFAALADPTRRALLARLSERETVSVSDPARPGVGREPASSGTPGGSPGIGSGHTTTGSTAR